MIEAGQEHAGTARRWECRENPVSSRGITVSWRPGVPPVLKGKRFLALRKTSPSEWPQVDGASAGGLPGIVSDEKSGSCWER